MTCLRSHSRNEPQEDSDAGLSAPPLQAHVCSSLPYSCPRKQGGGQGAQGRLPQEEDLIGASERGGDQRREEGRALTSEGVCEERPARRRKLGEGSCRGQAPRERKERGFKRIK